MAQLTVALHGHPEEPLGERVAATDAYRAMDGAIKFLRERGYRITDHTVGAIKMECAFHRDRPDPCAEITVTSR